MLSWALSGLPDMRVPNAKGGETQQVLGKGLWHVKATCTQSPARNYEVGVLNAKHAPGRWHLHVNGPGNHLDHVQHKAASRGSAGQQHERGHLLSGQLN